MSESIDDATIKSPQAAKELPNPFLEASAVVVSKDNVQTWTAN